MRLDLTPVINGNRIGSIRQRKSMRYALEWLDSVRPEWKDSRSGNPGHSKEKVPDDETCLIKVKPLQRSPLKTRHNSAKNYSKYREKLRESQTMRNRIHDSFVRCWNQSHRPIQLTQESRDLVPLGKPDTIRYGRMKNRGKAMHAERHYEREETNVELCRSLLNPFLGERREDTQGVIAMNGVDGEAIVIYRRNGNHRINEWKNYQFQEIAIEKATLDLGLSENRKRSSSETRREYSPGQMCITRSRGNKFHCEPVRMGRSVSIEFKKFDEIREMFHPEESNSIASHKRNENSFLWKSNEFRLRSTAEKKLNLFKELKKSERQKRRKFEETTARSLNQRGAAIEGFSTGTKNTNEEVEENEREVDANDSHDGHNTCTLDKAPPQAEHITDKDSDKRASLSDKDNTPTNSPKELSKQLALYKLRDILDELVSDREKVDDELTGSPGKGDCSTRTTVMNICGKDALEGSELEELMLKLKATLGNYNEILKPEETNFYGGTGISELLTPNNKFLDGVTPRGIPPVIAYPASTARSRSASCRKNDSNIAPDCRRHDWEERERFQEDDTQHWYDSRGTEKLVMTNLGYGGATDTNKSPRGFSEESSGYSERENRTKRSGNSRRAVESRDDYSHSSGEHSSRGGMERCMERKILKLERRLKGVLRRIGVCPPKDQLAIRKCLERLRETSEAVLKRLRMDRFDSCQRYCGDRGDTVDALHRGYQSEPDSAVRVNADKTPIILKTSGSEIQLNVGMEITMENFDPVTGKKLFPEENRDFEQQGNIQCKLLKHGEKPITFIDADFLYNPRTGMLFQRGQKTHRRHRSEDMKEPLKHTNAYLLSKTTKKSFPAETDSESSGHKSDLRERHETLQHVKSVKYRDKSSSPDTSKSMLADAFRIAIDREELKNARYFGKDTSRSFPSEKPKSSGKQRRVSLVTADINHDRKEVNTRGALKNVGDEKVQQTYHLHEKPQGNPYRGGIAMATVMVSDKGTQTNLGPRWKKSSEIMSTRTLGVQAEMKSRGKVLVNRAADTTFLGTPLWALRRGVNVCVQTSSVELLPGVRKGSDVSSQTDFLIEEAQKYMKDLETQKRVNLAIAELCYHLSNGTEVPGFV